ncbi:MAG: flagellar basal body L-ring protein FlgH [Campylobacterales bacterium]|nr:flagellar basal body L-ring protein FlgH [Campylobacterales bacterium]
MKQIIYLTITLIILAGCTSKLDPEIDFKPPKYVQEMPSKEDDDDTNLGSLYGSGDNPLFSDRKAMRVNDIVTVKIAETASSSSTGSKNLERTNEATLSPGTATYGGSSGTVATQVDNINNLTRLGFGYNTETSFTGTGTNSRTENFTTTISARIVKVMVNGNYFITV